MEGGVKTLKLEETSFMNGPLQYYQIMKKCSSEMYQYELADPVCVDKSLGRLEDKTVKGPFF